MHCSQRAVYVVIWPMVWWNGQRLYLADQISECFFFLHYFFWFASSSRQKRAERTHTCYMNEAFVINAVSDEPWLYPDNEKKGKNTCTHNSVYGFYGLPPLVLSSSNGLIGFVLCIVIVFYCHRLFPRNLRSCLSEIQTRFAFLGPSKIGTVYRKV